MKYGKIFSVTERVSNFFFLNLLWIIACLPIVTIFPSTAAMYGVIRDWTIKEETSLFRLFVVKFKENFKQSSILGLAWFFFGIVTYANLGIIGNLEDIFQTLVLSLLIVVGFLLVIVSLYMFTLMVHYNMPLQALWKNSFLLSLTYLPTTILATLIIFGMAVITYIFPILLTFVFSFTTYLLFSVCFRMIRI